MKRKILNIFVAVVMALSLCMMTAVPAAAAAAAITLTPDSGSPGTLNVGVAGTDFGATEEVNVYFDGALVATETTDGDGVLATTFDVPTGKAAGDYDVDAVGATSGFIATAVFTVPVLSITLDPTSGPPGLEIDVTGEGFTVSGLVKIYFGTTATLVRTTTADGAGEINTTFIVPDNSPASYSVIGKDMSSGSQATQTFVIPTPFVTLDPNEGPPALEIGVIGMGFKVGSDVVFKTGDDEWGTATADASGNITAASDQSITVPDIAADSYSVSANDTAGNGTIRPFTIPAPAINLEPPSGPKDTEIGVTGTGFKVGAAVDVFFEGIVDPVVTATAEADGTIDDTFIVPDVESGSYTITADDGVNTATAAFEVGAAIYLDDEDGPVGQEVGVTGKGFTPEAEVSITLDGTALVTTDANADGEIDDSFIVPDVLAGDYTVTAVDGTNTAVNNFTVLAPAITLNPTHGAVNSVVEVTGTNFKLNAGVTITFDGTEVATTTADAAGAIDDTFNVPNKGGDNIVAASDGVNSDNTTFSVEGYVGEDTGMLEDIWEEVQNIEGKLDGTVTSFITTIKTAVDAIKAKTDTINWDDITYIKTAVDDMGGGGGGVASASDTDVALAKLATVEIVPAGDEAFWGQLTVQSTKAGYNIEVWDGDSWVPVVPSGSTAHSVALSGLGLRIYADTAAITVDYVFVYHSASAP